MNSEQYTTLVQKKKLPAFSFAEGAQQWLNAQLPNDKSWLHWPKKLLPDFFLKFKLNKQGVTFLRECI